MSFFNSFYSLLQQTKGWDYLGLGGYHRSYQKIYQVTTRGLVLPHYISFADPIMSKYADENIEIIMRDLEIETWGTNQTTEAKTNRKKIHIESKESKNIAIPQNWLQQLAR